MRYASGEETRGEWVNGALVERTDDGGTADDAAPAPETPDAPDAEDAAPDAGEEPAPAD